MDEKINKYDEILENTNLAMQKVDSAFQNCNSTLTLVNGAVDKIALTVLQVKEIEKSIKIFDGQVELMCKEYDMRIEKCKIQASLVQSVLSGMSNKTDKILDQILSMDSYSDDVNYINYRSELIATLRSTSDCISNVFFHFITI
ncbi:hypothetical protein [Flavobacterium ovatum]|uniref:hypothetical protein n=1 Tax=Flavobacterium ovatum TaxID=1928857 RepID=UPI0034501639